MKKKKLIGILLLVLGLLMVLNNAEVINFELGEAVWTYWPILLIIAGTFNIISNPSAKKGGAILLTVGVLFQIGKLGYFDIFEYLSFWPLMVIIAGIWFILPGDGVKNKLDRDSFDTINIFSGSTNRLASKDFKGGSSIVAFGGVEIDLSQAEIKDKEARIDIFGAFGGAEITVPKDWNIVIKGLPIFAGWDDNTSKIDNPEAPTLIINCLLLFGGFEVKD